LDFDNQSKSIEAEPLYKEGCIVLKQAIGIPFTTSEWPNAKKLHEKMIDNLQRVEGRLKVIVQEKGDTEESIFTRLSDYFFGASVSKVNDTNTTQAQTSTNTTDAKRAQSSTNLNDFSSNTTSNTVYSKPRSNSLTNNYKNVPSFVTSTPSLKPKITTNPAPIAKKPRLVAQPYPVNNNTNGKKLSNDTQAAPLKGVDSTLANLILNEVVDKSTPVNWSDIGGLENCKQQLTEMIILPNLRPDIFKGIRSPAKGLLLFGPPGNGKTMLARAVAYESKATFFNISASSLVSKWVGESEKMVRTLFAIAKHLQPSVIFIDEIDSMLCERSSSENDSSRRLKTEFLVQMDGVATNPDDRVILMGATNRPQEIDEAARRRFTKRIYVPLPDKETRMGIINHALKAVPHSMSSKQLNWLASATEGYSGSDLAALCKEAAIYPVRELGKKIVDVVATQVRPVSVNDFTLALKNIRPCISQTSLQMFEKFNEEFGSL